MKRVVFPLSLRVALFLLLFAGLSASAGAQVLIDLNRGGHLRAKTTDDYAAERQTVRRAAADSTQWGDCVRRALSALAVDSLDEARTLFERALALRPEAEANCVVYENLGRIALSRGQLREAETQLTRALRLSPAYQPARLVRAAVRLEDGRPRETLEDVEALERLSLDSAARRQTLCLRFGAQMQQRLYAEARQVAVRLLSLAPDDAGAALMLILACEAEGRAAEALERANLFVERYPDMADGLTLRARLLHAAGQYDAALDDIDRAIALTPREADLYTARAEALLELGRNTAARSALDEAVRLGTPRAYLNTLYRRACR